MSEEEMNGVMEWRGENTFDEPIPEISQVLDSLNLPKYVKHEIHTERCIPHISPLHAGINNPFLLPLFYGFRRVAVKPLKVDPTKESKPLGFVYISPCGLILASYGEIECYLEDTKCPIEVDRFVFSPHFYSLSQLKHRPQMQVMDITRGIEPVPITFVNYINTEAELPFTYVNQHTFSADSSLKDFRLDYCCSCTDNCSDPLKCECVRRSRVNEGQDSNLGKISQTPKKPNSQLPSPGQHLPKSVPRLNLAAENDPGSIEEESMDTESDLDGRGQQFQHNGIDSNGTSSSNHHHNNNNHRSRSNSVDEMQVDSQREEDRTRQGQAPKMPASYESKHHYIFKRLLHKPQGYIFECNSRCKCNERCNNRVMSRGRFIPLRIFRNQGGLAVQTMYYIPVGTFITTYLGELKCEEHHSQAKYGDEYLANVSGIVNLDGVVRIKADLTPEEQLRAHKVDCTIDGHLKANVGALINHSCNPNLFVHQGFVEVHPGEKPMPVIGLFALKDILPGSELTWDYNYYTGDASTTTITCNCRTSLCRQILR